MVDPLVSVIIPTYNGEDYLGEAIQSVLGQTYSNLELIVVDDVSQDDTLAVVRGFSDSRMQCVVHDRNRGAGHARKTGLSASCGEIIAFLDQDDLFHEEKLASHVEFLANNPRVGFAYNSYFNLNHSSTTIRDIWRPPRNIKPYDLVFGFPVPPSVWVLRRTWALREELWDEQACHQGGEIVFCSRLFMAGCRFGMVDRILNYRRYHARRVFNSLATKCEQERTCQEIVYSDPRCPNDVLEERGAATANIYLLWTYVAYAQQETTLGQEFIRNAIRLHPALLTGMPCELSKFLLVYGVDDEAVDHEALLRSVFDQFPPEISRIANQYDWAASQGYLIKGMRAIMWDREEDADTYFNEAARLGASLDRFIVQMITSQLLAYETAFGCTAVSDMIRRLTAYLAPFDNAHRIRSLHAVYSVNRAFEDYRLGRYRKVPEKLLHGLITQPRYLTNRGVLSILFRSAFKNGFCEDSGSGREIS